MDIRAFVGIKFRGGRSFNLKKFVEIEEAEIADKINALDDVDEVGGWENDEDFEDNESLSLEF